MPEELKEGKEVVVYCQHWNSLFPHEAERQEDMDIVDCECSCDDCGNFPSCYYPTDWYMPTY